MNKNTFHLLQLCMTYKVGFVSLTGKIKKNI